MSAAVYSVSTREQQPVSLSILICKLELIVQLRFQLLSAHFPFWQGSNPWVSSTHHTCTEEKVPASALPRAPLPHSQHAGGSRTPKSTDLATLPGLLCGHSDPRRNCKWVPLPRLSGAIWLLPLPPTFAVVSFSSK